MMCIYGDLAGQLMGGGGAGAGGEVGAGAGFGGDTNSTAPSYHRRVAPMTRNAVTRTDVGVEAGAGAGGSGKCIRYVSSIMVTTKSNSGSGSASGEICISGDLFGILTGGAGADASAGVGWGGILAKLGEMMGK